MEKWKKPVYRKFIVGITVVLVIMAVILIAIGAYYGSEALMDMVGFILLFFIIIGAFILVLWIRINPVMHHVSRMTHLKIPGQRIEEALSQANIDHTWATKKSFLTHGETILLPNDITIVVKHYKLEDSGHGQHEIHAVCIGPLRKDNETEVDELKALVDRAL